jgi:hypothetical protein
MNRTIEEIVRVVRWLLSGSLSQASLMHICKMLYTVQHYER